MIADGSGSHPHIGTSPAQVHSLRRLLNLDYKMTTECYSPLFRTSVAVQTQKKQANFRLWSSDEGWKSRESVKLVWKFSGLAGDSPPTVRSQGEELAAAATAARFRPPSTAVCKVAPRAVSSEHHCSSWTTRTVAVIKAAQVSSYTRPPPTPNPSAYTCGIVNAPAFCGY